MKVDKYKLREVFTGEDSETLTVRYTNRGEPFSQGVEFEFDDGHRSITVYLETGELRRLGRTLEQLIHTLRR